MHRFTCPAFLATALLVVACSSSPAAGNASAVNLAACQSLAPALQCGSIGGSTALGCQAFAAVDCDLTPYLACLATKLVCVDGKYDAATLSTAGTCALQVPSGCTPPPLTLSTAPDAGPASAATLSAPTSVEVVSVGGLDAPAGDLYVAVDLVLTNTGTIALPLLPTLFSVTTTAGLLYAGDPVTSSYPQACDATASVAPGAHVDCSVVFRTPESAVTVKLSYELPSTATVSAPLTTEGCTRCGDSCVDLATDPENCGACGVVVGSLASCVAGAVTCNAGTTSCSDACTDLSTDPDNCGACGVAVPAGRTCSSGEPVCAIPLTSCGAACVDTSSDTNNCGACSHECGADQVCGGSTCVCVTSGDSVCPSGCVDLDADPSNCGACGKACSSALSCVAGACACPTSGDTACSGGCTDLMTDVANCGSCGSACSTGAGTASCVAGVCSTLTTLASGEDGPVALVLGGTELYWGDGSGAALKKVPVAGGSIGVLETGTEAEALAVYGSNVYFDGQTTGTIWTVPLGGATPVSLTHGSNPTALAVDATSLFWTDGSNLMRAPLAGGTATTVAARTNIIAGLVIDSTSFYFTDFGSSGEAFVDGAVVKLPLGGGTAVTLASAQTEPASILVDATNVYWTSGAAGGAILKVALAGGTPVTLASGLKSVNGIAVDSTSMYWTVQGVGGSVMKVGLGGGSPVTLATGQNEPGAIVVDSTSVYWANSGLNENDGSIMRLTPK